MGAWTGKRERSCPNMDRARSIDQSEVPASALGLTAPSSVRICLFPRWEELIASGGEGMVVKPLEFVTKGRKGLAQPAVKKLCNKVWRFSRTCTAQPHFADEMLRLVLGLRCPPPSPKRGTRAGFYHYCQRIRFGPTVKHS